MRGLQRTGRSRNTQSLMKNHFGSNKRFFSKTCSGFYSSASTNNSSSNRISEETTNNIRQEILTYARLGDVHKVLELLSSITLPDSSTNQQRKEIELEKENIIHTLMLAYAKKGSLHKTEILFRKLKNPTLKCYTILLGAYASKGMIDKVEQLFSKIEKPDEACYVVLLNTYSKAGMIEKIEKVYNNIYFQLSSFSKKNDNTESDLLTDLSDMIKSTYMSSRETEYFKDNFIVASGFRMYNHMKRKEYKIVDEVYHKVKPYLGKSNSNISNIYLQSLIHRNMGVEKVESFVKSNIAYPDGVTYHLMMVYYFKLKQYDKVDRLYKEVVRLDQIEESKRNYYDTMIMTMYYEREMYDKVEKIFRQVKSPDYKCYLILMRSYLKQQDTDRVIQLFKEIPSEMINDHIVTEMMTMLRGSNHTISQTAENQILNQNILEDK